MLLETCLLSQVDSASTSPTSVNGGACGSSACNVAGLGFKRNAFFAWITWGCGVARPWFVDRYVSVMSKFRGFLKPVELFRFRKTLQSTLQWLV